MTQMSILTDFLMDFIRKWQKIMGGKHKVAFVTGGGTGIGQGISIELAKAGYDVAFSY